MKIDIGNFTILGGLTGLCFYSAARLFKLSKSKHTAFFYPTIGAFTVVLLIDLNISINSFNSIQISELPTLLVSLSLVLSLVLSFKSSRVFTRFQLLMNPWTISLMMLGLCWINTELWPDYSRVFKIIGSSAYFLIVFSGTYLIQKKT